MLVEEVMTPRVVTADVDATASDAAAIMKKEDIGWLPVTLDDAVTGVVTDRDLAVRVLAEGRDPGATPVRDVMSPAPVVLEQTATAEEAAKGMEEKKVRRLLVTDADGRPSGTLSLGDLAARGHREQLTGEVLERVCSAR
ncbi:MAG: CBS domain-containing protein [Planctomycetota bacterium]